MHITFYGTHIRYIGSIKSSVGSGGGLEALRNIDGVLQSVSSLDFMEAVEEMPNLTERLLRSAKVVQGQDVLTPLSTSEHLKTFVETANCHMQAGHYCFGIPRVANDLMELDDILNTNLRNAVLNYQDQGEGMTLLHRLISRGEDGPSDGIVLKLITKYGCDPTIEDVEGKSVISLAKASGRLELAENMEQAFAFLEGIRS